MKRASLWKGTYVLGEPLGRGGTASVYRARRSNDRTDANELAVKVIPLDEIEGPQAVLERYHRIARLHHPNLLPILDLGISDRMLFVVSPLAEEGSLRELLRRGSLSPQVALRIMCQIADALQYLHDQGILHLDVKPANIMLAAGHEPMLGDFGLSEKLAPGPTGRPRVRGTPAYMAPEQCQVAPIGPPGDQYALAVTSFEPLTGRRPFMGGSPDEMLRRQVFEPPPSPSRVCPWLPVEVDEVLLRALVKDPARRFPSVSAFASALNRAMATVRSDVPPPRSAESSEPATLEAVTVDIGPGQARYHV